MKHIRSQTKKDQTKINIITIKKNHIFDLKSKIKNHKNYDKRAEGKIRNQK
jgi:hypothetical protein